MPPGSGIRAPAIRVRPKQPIAARVDGLPGPAYGIHASQSIETPAEGPEKALQHSGESLHQHGCRCRSATLVCSPPEAAAPRRSASRAATVERSPSISSCALSQHQTRSLARRPQRMPVRREPRSASRGRSHRHRLECTRRRCRRHHLRGPLLPCHRGGAKPSRVLSQLLVWIWR